MNGTDAEESGLHKQLIEYATTSYRLLFIQDVSVFEEFQPTDEFNDLSTIELNAVMLNYVLPKIFSYQLTEAARKRLKFLDMHPDFQRTDQGYKYAPQQHLNVSYVLTPKSDFSPVEQLPDIQVSLRLNHPNFSNNNDSLLCT